MESNGLEAYDKVRKYYNYKVDSYESKYKSGYITHLHTGLFDPEVIHLNFDNLIEIQDVLIKGQSQLTQRVIDLIPTDSKYILDIGCGHGGTAITLIQQRTARVQALTISDRQGDLVKVRAEQLGLANRIHVVIDNVLEHNFEHEKFDAVIGVESFCQIDHLQELSATVQKVLKPGGCLIISDYYTGDLEFKNRFAKHWCCAVKPFDELRLDLDKQGITLMNQLDLTLDQAPFWKLSAMHSSLKLQLTHSDKESTRLHASKAFHEYMYSAFLKNIGQYYISVFQKEI